LALLDKFNRFANQFSDLLGDIADDVRAHVELAAQLLERGDYEAAIRELRHALDKRRDHARAHYLLGLCYLRRAQPGDLTAAKRALGDALAAKEGYAEAYIALGDVQRQAGEPVLASESYRQALPLLDDELQRAELELQLGTVYLDLGQLDKAVRELRKSVSSNPDDAKAQGLLGQALVLQAQKRNEAPGSPTWDAARQCLLKASRAEQADPQVLTTLGKLLLSSGQVPDAEKALLRAVQAAPERVETLLLLGELRIQQGDTASAYEQGLRAYSSARKENLALGMAESHRLLARCHTRSGSPERALGALREAEAVLPTDAMELRTQILRDAMELSLRHGLTSEAVALAKQPLVSESPLGLLAQSLDASLPIADAEALLTRALAAGDGVEVRLAQASLEQRKGNTAGAASHYRRAASLAPSDPRPRKALAALYDGERKSLPKELYGLLLKVHQHFAKTPELSEWLPDAAKLVETLDRPLLVTVMGEFNSGKSTFVNALLGEEVAPMGITPTTATINILRYGRERAGRVVYRDGQSRTVGWDKVPALLRGLDPVEVSRIRVVEVLYPLEVLQRVNVVDTPGLNSILPEHEAVAREFIAQADAVIWLFTVDQAGKASELEALTSIRSAGKQILGVLNKIDRLPQMTPIPDSLSPEPSQPDPSQPDPSQPDPSQPDQPQSLQAILAHLSDPDTGLNDVLEVVVPFSGRQALLGRKNKDEALLAQANLPALERALEERFFQRSQAIKNAAARTRLGQLLDRAQKHAESLLHKSHHDELDQAQRLLAADALLFARDFIPSERKRLIAEAGSAHQVAAQETLSFVRPRRWAFGEHQAAPADRDFLLNLLDDKLSALCQSSRARVVEALVLGPDDGNLLRLLDEQVYGRYLAFSRGYLRGGKVDDFFVRVLPKLDLSEAAIGRALERDSPTAVDILESELLSPLRSFGEARYRQAGDKLLDQLAKEELRQLDIDERVLFPLTALGAALAAL
jgi:tetratricopeptide (TPR) repeat protein/GTPase SAR1 family protein